MRGIEHIGIKIDIVPRLPESQRTSSYPRIGRIGLLQTSVFVKDMHGSGGQTLFQFLIIRMQSKKRKLKRFTGDHAILKGHLTLRLDIIQLFRKVLNSPF